MEPIVKGAIPVLPAADTAESLNWWTEVCGFKETFRDRTPPSYAGINRGDAFLHIAGMDDKVLARKVGDQTMVRLAVKGIEAMYAEYQGRGGKVHPNGSLQTKPWGYERVRCDRSQRRVRNIPGIRAPRAQTYDSAFAVGISGSLWSAVISA